MICLYDDQAIPIISVLFIGQMHVWRKFDAAKDDIYVIDKEGKIALFFAKPDSDLNKENVKMGLKNVLESGSPCS